jgi:ATP-dependent helicase/nuclease subunit A
LFLSKYKRFTQDGHQSGLRIDLNKNFRSRSQVLDATNFIFRQIMDETVGEIDYDDDASLKLGASYPKEEGMEPELLLVTKEQPESSVETEEEGEQEAAAFSEAELETAQLEARLMARKIRDMVQSRFQVYDRGLDRMRNVTYRDFVILLRSMPWAPQIMEEFKQHGIPLYANLAKGYFDATEITIMMSLLQVVDNPHQDIPLASVLRSPIVGVNDEELAVIRLADKNGTYYEALQSFMKAPGPHDEIYQKVSVLYEALQTWRTQARQGALSSLIWQLYRDTGFFEFVGGLPGGKQRQANLRALYDRARQYESTSFRGLFRFLRFIERMRDRGDDLGTARALGEQEDVVRLMTIHSSKGLEFPIVFVAGLSRQFNMMDLHQSYLFDKELGFGSKLVNPKLRVSYPTLLQQTMKRKMKKETLAEEMRVLYVALTRAKEKLILVGTVNRFESTLSKWKSVLPHPDWVVPDHLRSQAKNYLDWIGVSLIRHQSAKPLTGEDTEKPVLLEAYEDASYWKFEVIHASELADEQLEEQSFHEELLQALKDGKPVPVESEKKEEIMNRLEWTYEFQAASVHRSKQSVSDMKHQQRLTEDSSDHAFVRRAGPMLFDRPRFMQEKSLTAAERGTAMHLVMQHVPLGHAVTTELVKELVASMITKELLTSEQAEAIDCASVAAFFETDIGRRLQKARQVYREMPFSLSIPASEAYSTWSAPEEEAVLVQGVIDCLFEEEGGFVLVDFKTDNISERFEGDFEKAKPVLLDRYQLQVRLYSQAIESILGRPVAARYLYFFDGSQVMEV